MQWVAPSARSATLDIKIPTGGGQMTSSDVGSYVGGVYDALLIGVATAKPAFGSWTFDGGRLTIIEEGQRYETDILIVGSGIAGLRAAIALAPWRTTS